LQVGLPQFPSDFPDCNAHLSFMVNERAALDQKVERLPPSVRPLKVPMPFPWNSVRLALDKGSAIVQDPQISGRKDNIDDNSLLSSEDGDCAKTAATGHCNSFDGFVGRTSSILIDFLSEIHASHLLLFPHIPNKKTRLSEFIKDESILSKGQCSAHQITSNRRLCFIRVLLHAYKEGFFEEGAVVCAPGPNDLSMWISRYFNKTFLIFSLFSLMITALLSLTSTISSSFFELCITNGGFIIGKDDLKIFVKLQEYLLVSMLNQWSKLTP
jgi:ribonuclease P/MRP protein subunit POP1